MKKQTVLIASLASLVVLSGCSVNKPCCSEVNKQAQKLVQVQPRPAPVYKAKKPELMKISGIGYGAQSSYGAYTPGQRRLMAIRASKLDAYRALAEQIHGIKIDSNTSVATLTAKSDSFRARVNAVVRGARIVSVTPMADNNYETVLEVYVDKGFFEQNFIYSAEEARALDPEAIYQVSSF
ncbi:MAG: outer membrane protein FlgP [Thiomicrorhabdus sp.]|nr:MAG: outer membrane protein FlgP [Thiomicrorhabdus sp.]